MVDINRVKSEFERIKKMGFIESDRPFAVHNDGAIGNTFETILGVKENNLKDLTSKVGNVKPKDNTRNLQQVYLHVTIFLIKVMNT